MAAAMQQPAELLEVGLPYVDPMGRLLVDDIYNQVAFWQSLNLVDKGADAKDMARPLASSRAISTCRSDPAGRAVGGSAG